MSQHGRIKVRTTAEQAEAKRKEREKKLKIYQQTTNRIYEKVYFTTSKILNKCRDDNHNLCSCEKKT